MNTAKPYSAARVDAIAPFHVMAILAQAQALEAAGRDIIHLEIGEPDFATPAPIVEAGIAALRAGHTHYTCALGLPALRALLGDTAQFLVISDGSAAQLRPLLEAVPCVTTGDIPDADCSDLLALADADLLVCSISSYSLWAAFLSNAPYLWFAPSLQRHSGNRGSLWGGSFDEQAVPPPGARLPRGIPVGLDGAIPAALPELLRERRADLRAEHDLVRGGFAPLP